MMKKQGVNFLKNFFQKTIDKRRGMCYNNNVRKINTTERGT